VKSGTLGSFILSEIEKRKMSARAFADMVGVTHKTINKFLNYGTKDVGYPSVDFLLKLARATNTDICYLMTLVDPNAPNFDHISPEDRALSTRIGNLPPHLRDAIDAMIIGAVLNNKEGE
jgi:transcriptional regulator with XRE-family HTH domain